MSTRTSSSRLRSAALADRASRSRCVAARRAGGASGKKSRRPTTASQDDPPTSPRAKLPPILLKALHEKEAEVTAARREAIKLIESYLHDSPHSKEQAEAMYKLAELYWEESKAVYLEKMGRYQAAVTACHTDRAECPKVPHRPPTVDLVAGAGGLPAAHQGLPEVPQDRHRHLPLRVLAARPGRRWARRSSTSRSSSTSTRAPATSPTPGWRSASIASTSSRTTRARSRRTRRSSPTRSRQLYDLALFKTAWCYWKLGDTNKSRPAFQGRPRSRQEEGGAHRGGAEARRGAARTGARLPGRAVHRGRHQERPRRLRVPRPDRRQAVLAQGVEAARRHRVRPDPLRARRRGLPPAHRARSRTAPRPPTTTARSSSRTSCSATSRPPSPRCASSPSTYGGRSPWAAANKDRPKSVEHARDAGRGAHPQRRQDHALGGAAEREGDQGRRQGALRARRRVLRVLPGQLPRRRRRRRAALPARRHPLLQARQVRGRRARVPRGRQVAAGRQVPQGRAAAGDGRVREGAQAGSRRAASARSPTAIACSARRPTSTRRCSPRTRRSSPSSTRTVSSSSTTATTTRRSSASASSSSATPTIPTPARPATASCRRSTRRRTTRTSRAGRAGSRRPRRSPRRTSRSASTS